ncbi:MAG: hypothetical protein LBQ02_02080 [Candidatus Nomurabacteria bacterium]|jgi:hypothetical protein|nr:hypothetical protein [Candidatus Nomurabacteria bacterium]
MDNQKQLLRQKSILLILLAALAVGLILFTFFKPHTNPYGNQITITNLTLAVPDLPQDRIDAISASLYNRVSSIAGELSNVSATVRDNSTENSFDSTQNIHYGNFIVDIASTKHSFKIYFEWSDDSNNPNLSGYAVVISCLPENQLIYGTFPCQDDPSTLDPIRDPIVDYLPYMSVDFSIKLRIGEDNQLSLDTDLFFVSWDYNENGQPKPSAITRQKKLVAEWFESHNLDINSYTINYKY